MSITFFAAPASSSSPVACALLELAVPHERVNLDLAKGEQKRPEFLAQNPNGKVPTLVVDGAPIFEAVAILQWLGDRYGVARGIWPAADSPLRLRALAWTSWAYVSFGYPLSRLFYASSERLPAAFHNAAVAADSQAELQKLLALLNSELKAAPYLLGKEFSLADLVLSCTVNYARLCGVPTTEHTALEAWLARCAERPSLKTPWI